MSTKQTFPTEGKVRARKTKSKHTKELSLTDDNIVAAIEGDDDFDPLPSAQDSSDERDHLLNLQLELFQTVDPSRPEQDQEYSNTVDLYDSLPKYDWDTGNKGVEIDRLIRWREVKGQRYKVIVTPASIIRNGEAVKVFPGIREEIIEDVLRKFVAAGQYTVHGGEVGVRFSLNQLYQELASLNRTYSRSEIKEGIEVCLRSVLEVQSEDGTRVMLSPFFPNVMFTNREEWERTGGEARCYVRFNPLVTTSIVEDTWRRYNYKVAMSIRSSLARFIYKRISHHWIQAASDAPYSFRLLNMLEQTPRGVTSQMGHNIRAMTNALNTLVKQHILTHYDEERLMDSARKNKVLDIRYSLFPHESFIRDAKAANKLKGTRELQRLQRNMK